MSEAEFANWVLVNLPLDTWLNVDTIQRRLAGIHNQRFTAAGLLNALIKAGWTQPHPNFENHCLARFCWLSEKPKSR